MPTLKIPIKYKEFLDEHHAFGKFVQNYKLSLKGLNSTQIGNKINETNSLSTFELFLKTSFIWEESDQGRLFWLLILDDYNNKNL